MKRFGLVLMVGALLLALSAGVALAVLKEGNNNNNTLRGTSGDDEGQDTLIGFGGNDTLIGRSAADQLDGGSGDDELRGQPGNDTLVGGPGNDKIYMGPGFDFVFAADDEQDLIDCNKEPRARIEFDRGLDDFQNCNDFDVDSASLQSATSDGGSGGGDDAVVEG